MWPQCFAGGGLSPRAFALCLEQAFVFSPALCWSSKARWCRAKKTQSKSHCFDVFVLVFTAKEVELSFVISMSLLSSQVLLAF